LDALKAEVPVTVGAEVKPTGTVTPAERSVEGRTEATPGGAVRTDPGMGFKEATLLATASTGAAKLPEEKGHEARREDATETAATVVSEGGIPAGAPNPRSVLPSAPLDLPKGLDEVSNHLGNATRMGDRIPSVVQATGDGTISASSSNGMRRAGKQDKSAGNGVQKLPGTADLRAGSAGSAAPTADTGVRRAQGSGDGVAEVIADGALLAGVTRGRDEKARGGIGLAGEMSPTTEARLQKIEELISKEVVRFRWSGQESVSVMIRPEEGTEVEVHFRQREGQMEAVLGMARGEAARFNGHWQQLHDALAEQNVRLLPGREPAQALNPAGAGTNLNMGTGSGSGSGPGGNPSPGNQQGSGSEWRDGFGGGLDERSADRRRAPEVAPFERERPGARGTTPGRRAVRSAGPVGRPEGWEFWA